MTVDDKKLDPIKCNHLAKMEGVCHGFFTRQGGFSKGIYAGLNCGLGSRDSRSNVLKNRKLIAKEISKGKVSRINTVNQVHGNKVIRFPLAGTNHKPPRADGAITNEPWEILAILTADCAPVLFFDQNASVIGACHAGWRGAINGVIENTIREMVSLGASRSQIISVIGPCIGHKSYQVGKDFWEQFISIDASNRWFFKKTKQGSYLFDLQGFVKKQLHQSDVQTFSTIEGDTFTETQKFFSFRRSLIVGEPDYGRMVSAIMLRS
ncbi:MAG: peptidoglycan editing factor PgeF [Pseudomonadota bacterium]|nr:peptidoglycan editing factor PgeF [Pseudomonadota bacterium]